MSERKLSVADVMTLAAQPLKMYIFPRRSFKQREHGKLGDSEQAEPRILAGYLDGWWCKSSSTYFNFSLGFRGWMYTAENKE